MDEMISLVFALVEQVNVRFESMVKLAPMELYPFDDFVIGTPTKSTARTKVIQVDKEYGEDLSHQEKKEVSSIVENITQMLPGDKSQVMNSFLVEFCDALFRMLITSALFKIFC